MNQEKRFRKVKCIFKACAGVLLSLVMALQGVGTIANVAKADGSNVPFPVNYDPNEGMIHYGHSGEVGMRPENDVNNYYEATDRVVYFPRDVINDKDESGNKLFPDYDPSNPYYDYTDMFNHALQKARDWDNAAVFVEDGVYYFTKSVYLSGSTSINAVAGKTAFVIKPNYQDVDGNSVETNGFFTNKNLKETYTWYSSAKISDIVFVVEGTHSSFKPTSSVENIMSNLLSDDIQAVNEFSLFYRVRTKYAAIDNIAASGFESFMRWTFTDMLTRVTSVTVGPTRYVYRGVQTNDAFFYDGYYYGGYYSEEDIHTIPVFQVNFSMGTTVFANSYIGNYYFSRSGAGCWCPHTTYSNLTLERTYNFVMDTTTTSSSVSGCYFKDCSYNDIKAYFEGQGLTAYDHSYRYWDPEKKQHIYPNTGYVIRDSIVGDSTFDKKSSSVHESNDKTITMIELHQGIAFTQNKIECDSLNKTILVKLTNSEWSVANTTHRREARNIHFSDNAFKIRDWTYENLMIDDWKNGRPYTEGWHDNTIVEWGERGWNNSDGTPAMGFIGVEGPEAVCWLDDGVYISREFYRYIDLGAFTDPNRPTAGYAALGPVGADEQALFDADLEDRYYYDLKSGNYEIKYFEEDFGGFSWNTSSNHEKLQEAFDYVASHDAILYIESGTYCIDKPIVLRGGATYRVVFNGQIDTNITDDISGAGAFVMSSKDNAPINGYFYGVDLYLHNCNTSGFFNVNFDNFYMKVGSIARGVGAFTNCKINNSVIHEGQIQYNDYGFFYKTVTDNLLVKNVYGTSSTGYEGEDGYTPGDLNYKYFISSSDFTNSTWRGCWLEFGQFSNGKTLTGAGNSVYRGNIIDYTYNYSFGKNDVVCGNTMTRADYGSIVNHMVNSNFPIDKPDALTDKPMIMYHINDGLRLIGNTNLGSMNPSCHFIEFDSPSITYTDENGNTVKSFSNVRVAGNLVYTIKSGDYKQTIPVMPFGITENVVFENCDNNQILLQTFYLNDQEDDPATPVDETYRITEDIVKSWSIPGVKFYVNGTYVEVKEPEAPEKKIEQVIVPQPPQDEVYDVPNVWKGEKKQTAYVLYDFKKTTDAEAQALAEKLVQYIDLSTINFYRNSIHNKVMIGEVEKALAYSWLKDLSTAETYHIYKDMIKYGLVKSPSGSYSFYMDSSRQKESYTNDSRPTYSIVFRDELISGEALQTVSGSFWYDFEHADAWQGKRPMILILSEDARYYHGIILSYRHGNDGINVQKCALQKNYFNEYIESDEKNLLPQYHFQYGIEYFGGVSQLSNYDNLADITCPHSGHQKAVYGDYTTTQMFGGDLTRYESLVLCYDFTCEYNDAYDTVAVYATVDFSKIGEDTSVEPALKATTRKVWLGTFPLEGRDKIFGLWNGEEMWLESVQFEYIPETEVTCKHSFAEEITREGTCTHDTVLRYTCTLCGDQYEDYKRAKGHTFVEYKSKKSGMTVHKCTVCGFSYESNDPIKNECKHSYQTTVIKTATCTEEGTVNYTCTICEESYTENVRANGHSYYSTVVNPTMTSGGYTVHTCSVCGDSYKDNYTDPLSPPPFVPTVTSVPRPTVTPRPAVTSAPRPTVTPRPTSTPRPTVTPRVTATPKPTVTPKVTVTPSPTAKPTATVAPTKAPVVTATPVPTKAPEVTVTPTPAMTKAPETTVAPKPTETVTPMPTEAVTPTRIPMPTATPEVTETPIPTNAPEVTATAVPTKTPEATDTPAPTKAPTATATPRPTKAPRATATPVPTESPEPTASPKLEPITKETGDLVITVTDERSGAGREGVEVELLYPSGEAKQYVTNANGKIYLYELQPGNYEATPYVVINGQRMAIGIKEDINIRKNATELYDITMDFTLYDTAEVDVKPTDTKDVVIPIAVAGVILFAGIVVFFCRKRR